MSFQNDYQMQMTMLKKRYYYIFRRIYPLYGRNIDINIIEIEQIALQMRLMIEGVCFSCALANNAFYNKIKIQNWEIARDIKYLKENGLYFLPLACELTGSNKNGLRILAKPERDIKEAEFIRIHGMMGNLLHWSSKNKIDKVGSNVINEIIDFIPKFRKMMQVHCLPFPGSDNLHMILVNLYLHRKNYVHTISMNLVRNE